MVDTSVEVDGGRTEVDDLVSVGVEVDELAANKIVELIVDDVIFNVAAVDDVKVGKLAVDDVEEVGDQVIDALDDSAELGNLAA